MGNQLKLNTELWDFHNLNQGLSSFVVGAGPSLAGMNIGGIHKHIVLSVNSSIKLMDVWLKKGDTSKRFWVSTDTMCRNWTYYKSHVEKVYCTRILRSSWKKYNKSLQNLDVRYFRPRSSFTTTDGGLSSGSSVLAALDFAILMGCSKVFLLGVDHAFVRGKSHFWQLKIKPGKSRVLRADKEDSKPEQTHQMAVFAKNIPVFEQLKEYGENGTTVCNCSKISTLRVFPKITLEQALEMA